MISHVFLGVNDFDRAMTLYAALMHELGHTLKFCDRDRPWAGWMPTEAARPLFLIGSPYDGQPAHNGNGQMLAFLATNRAVVDRSYASALENGATCEGPPGLRPEYHADYYGAYFRDGDGNKICVVCHAPDVTVTQDR